MKDPDRRCVFYIKYKGFLYLTDLNKKDIFDINSEIEAFHQNAHHFIDLYSVKRYVLFINAKEGITDSYYAFHYKTKHYML